MGSLFKTLRGGITYANVVATGAAQVRLIVSVVTGGAAGADVFIGVVGISGNGNADPAFANVLLQVK